MNGPTLDALIQAVADDPAMKLGKLGYQSLLRLIDAFFGPLTAEETKHAFERSRVANASLDRVVTHVEVSMHTSISHQHVSVMVEFEGWAAMYTPLLRRVRPVDDPLVLLDRVHAFNRCLAMMRRANS